LNLGISFFFKKYLISFVAAVESHSNTTRHAYDKSFLNVHYGKDELHDESIDCFIEYVKSQLRGTLSILIIGETEIYKKDTLIKLESNN
jgi:hypothetical protein